MRENLPWNVNLFFNGQSKPFARDDTLDFALLVSPPWIHYQRLVWQSWHPTVLISTGDKSMWQQSFNWRYQPVSEITWWCSTSTSTSVSQSCIWRGRPKNVSLIGVVWTKCLVSQQSASMAKSANTERTSMHCMLTITHIHPLVSQPYAWVDKTCHAFDYLRPYSSQVGASYLRRWH